MSLIISQIYFHILSLSIKVSRDYK